MASPSPGYALDNASEWKEVLKTAAQAALILVVLDLLRLTKNSKCACGEDGLATAERAPPQPGTRGAHAAVPPPAATGFEEHVDFLSMQAVLFNGAARSWWAQTRTLVALQARLTDD